MRISGEELNDLGLAKTAMMDIDDTLVDTRERVRAAWNQVLGCELTLDAMESLGSRQILERFGDSSQEVWKRFWKVLLCPEQTGTDLLKLDKPVPHAAEVLNKWSTTCDLVYITGRPETMREQTLTELKTFDFPVEDVQLKMFTPDDWENFTSPTILINARHRLVTSIAENHCIVKVIDDYPRFFSVYKQFNIPDRIGLLTVKRHSRRDYISQGATRVIESWNELENEPFNPTV